MRRLGVGFFAAMALFCASRQTLGNGPGDAAPRAAFDQFTAAFNSLDWEAFRRCFADSASLFNPDIPDASDGWPQGYRAQFSRGIRRCRRWRR